MKTSYAEGKYTDRSRRFVQFAQLLAQKQGHQLVGPEHLLKVLLDDQEGLTEGLIARAGGNAREALVAADAALQKCPKVSGDVAAQPYIDRPLARVFATAEELADKSGDSYVTVERLLLAIAVETSKEAGSILARAAVTPGNLEAAIRDIRKGRVAGSAMAEANYEALGKYTHDLTTAAGEGKLDPVFGRDDEIRRVTQVLSLRTKNNPVLVGEPGVGKTAIVNALAQRMYVGDVPEILRNKKLLALNMGALIAGSKYRGEFEERFKAVLDELKYSTGRCILLIDGMHILISGGRSQSANEAASLLKPAIDNGELQCIGTTTPGGYRTYIESDEALARRLQPIFVSEPSVEDTISILRAVKARYEQHHEVRIADSALIAAATLSGRYHYAAHRFLPDKAIDLIDEAAVRLRQERDSKPYEIDDLDRRIIQLKIEQEALRREDEPSARERSRAIETELRSLEAKSAELTVRWRFDLDQQSGTVKLRAELDRLWTELDQATRNADFQRAGEIKYARIPEVEKRLQAATSGTAFHVPDTVAPHHVAYVISREVGIPVKQILNDETAGDETRKSGQSVQSGKIFISYRRDDVAGHAGRIHDRLRNEFGADLVFMDVDSIPFGSDFVSALRNAVEQCEVLLALVGPNWLDARDDGGSRRLDDPNDFVRLEIATALDRDVQVIPILLPGTSMPKADQLPDNLRGLALRQALEVRHVSFQSDIGKLIAALKDYLSRPAARRTINS